MRAAQDGRRRGKSRRAPPSRNVLDLERLENRLALGHAPMSGPDATSGLWTAEPPDAPAPNQIRLEATQVGSLSSAPSRDFADYRALDSDSEIVQSAGTRFAPNFRVNVPEVQAFYLTSPSATIGERIAPIVVVFFDRTEVSFEYSAIFTASPQSMAHRELDGSVDASASDSGKLSRPQISAAPPVGLLVPNSLNANPSLAAPEFLGDLGHVLSAPTAFVTVVVQQKPPAIGLVPASSIIHPLAGILVPPSRLHTAELVDTDPLDENQRDENDVNNSTDSTGHIDRSAQPSLTVGSRATFGEITANPEESRSDLRQGFAAQRATLLASIGFDNQAVERALDAAMSEIDQIGGDLMSWFDDYSGPSWVTAADIAAVVAAGSAYAWHDRQRRSREEDDEAVSSTWLFNRLQMPAGQP